MSKLNFAIPVAMCPPQEYTAIATCAEQHGFDAIAMSDHLIYPQQFSTPYPYTSDGKPRFSPDDPWPDPWIAISAMAAVTTSLKFYTNVYVLPTREPLHVAKFMSTLSVMTNNRVALGVGMGWMPEEFAASGQSFRNRGKRADEMLEIMQKLWNGKNIEHQGEFYQFEPFKISPTPDQDIPIYVGGFSKPAMKRAAKYDGWISDLHSLDELSELIQTMNEYRQQANTADKPFEVLSFGCKDTWDADGFKRMRDIGVTTMCHMPWFFYGGNPKSPLEEKLDAIKRFSEDFIQPVNELT